MTLQQLSTSAVAPFAQCDQATTGPGCVELRVSLVIADQRTTGLPAPQGSKKHGQRDHGGILQAGPPAGKDLMIQSRDQYGSEPLTGPLEMEIIFWFPRPQTHYRVIGGELSNVIKDNKPTYTTSCSDGDLDKVVSSLWTACQPRLVAASFRTTACGALSCEKRYVTESGRLRGIHTGDTIAI